MLQQRLRGLRRNNKKGFTLVELLAVIVILCILAAILIPTFSKYVKKAENATLVAEARAAHVAASVLYQEANIKARTAAGFNGTVADAAYATTIVTQAAIKDLASVNGVITKVLVNTETGTVEGFVYANAAANASKWVSWVKTDGMYNADAQTEPTLTKGTGQTLITF